MHLCAELIAASMMLEPLGEIGANFSLQLSSRTQFTKIKNKEVIAENECEKHKKWSLGMHQVLRLEFQKFRILEILNFHPCKGTDQLVHPNNQIAAFVNSFLESTKAKIQYSSI